MSFEKLYKLEAIRDQLEEMRPGDDEVVDLLLECVKVCRADTNKPVYSVLVNIADEAERVLEV